MGSAELLKAVHDVLEGRLVISPEIERQMMDAYLSGKKATDSQTPQSILSDREFEVFQMIGKGRSGRDISHALRISKSTVESHRAHIKAKLGLDSPADLVRAAVAWILENEAGTKDT